MITLLVNIATVLTLIIGIGGLLYAVMFVWAHLFELLLTLLRVKKEFIAWVREKNKPKVYKPKIKKDSR